MSSINAECWPCSCGETVLVDDLSECPSCMSYTCWLCELTHRRRCERTKRVERLVEIAMDGIMRLSAYGIAVTREQAEERARNIVQGQLGLLADEGLDDA